MPPFRDFETELRVSNDLCVQIKFTLNLGFKKIQDFCLRDSKEHVDRDDWNNLLSAQY